MSSRGTKRICSMENGLGPHAGRMGYPQLSNQHVQKRSKVICNIFSNILNMYKSRIHLNLFWIKPTIPWQKVTISRTNKLSKVYSFGTVAPFSSHQTDTFMTKEYSLWVIYYMNWIPLIRFMIWTWISWNIIVWNQNSKISWRISINWLLMNPTQETAWWTFFEFG